MKTKDFNEKTNRCGNVKTSFQRFILLMVTIMVSMAFVGCDGEIGNGGGKGRTLTAEEQKLVGQYSYNITGTGYWAYYNSGYDYWKNGWGTYGNAIWFKPDGTFNSVSLAIGSAFTKGGSVSKSTAKWSIPREGIVRFSDYVENTEYADGSKSVWRQSEHPGWNPDSKYEFKQMDDGTVGIMWGDGEVWYKFYTKTD